MDEITRHYRDALRMLFILARAGEPLTESATVPGALAVVDSQKKLQKLDFWVRNPDHFAYALLKAYEEQEDAGLLALAKSIADSKEPEIRRDAMLKYLYGAYEPLDTALAPLFSYGMASSVRNGKTKQRMYFLLPKGQEVADRMAAEVQEAQWYSARTTVIGGFAEASPETSWLGGSTSTLHMLAQRTGKPLHPLHRKYDNG
ncbi:hypothetical protein [Paraburkholderia sediminicola]|uniref:hypothetical protein n=1 Tax=Paraburkholderia sediminicola TaxID=458836 RepID=UPI0038B873AC